MKFILLFLSSILLCCTLSAQKKVRNNLWGVDFHYWCTSFHFASKVEKNLYAGFEVGLLGEKFDWVLLAGKNFTEENTIWSDDRSEVMLHELNHIAFGHILVRWKPQFEWIEIDGGFRLAAYIRNIPYDDSIGAPTFVGIFFKPALGFKNIKIGVRLSYGGMFERLSSSKEWVAMSSPFLRINFN